MQKYKGVELYMAEINMNMLRNRANALKEVTDIMYLSCNKNNRDLIDGFFEENPTLSPQTKKQYWSALRQFLWFVHEKLNDKNWESITKREFNKYLNMLISNGMSSGGIKLKKSAVSTVCEYIIDVLSEDDGLKYGTFRNFTKGKMKIAKNQVYEKIAITEEEYHLIMDTLLEKEKYMEMAWVACAFASGARRGGLRQFKSEIANQKIKDGQKFFKTNIVREKGASIDGKPVDYLLPVDVMTYIKLWLEHRGYEHEYLFTVRYGGNVKQISLGWANGFCKNVLSEILGRRVNPHLWKGSAITNYLSKGLSLKFVSQNIAKHNDTSTTINHYDLRGCEDEANDEFSKL